MYFWVYMPFKCILSNTISLKFAKEEHVIYRMEGLLLVKTNN